MDAPFLDEPLPREYVLYLRPSGPLQNQLSHFWEQSRVTCGRNKAHNIFPHITLCQFFMVRRKYTHQELTRVQDVSADLSPSPPFPFSSPPFFFSAPFTQCADQRVEALGQALQTTVGQWRGRFPSPLPLELYSSPSFIGLFVQESVADVMRQFAADFSTEAARKAGESRWEELEEAAVSGCLSDCLLRISLQWFLATK